MTNTAPAAPDVSGRRPRALLRSLLGTALRRIRLTQERTLADVAVAARISMPYLSEIERGRKEASSEVLAAVCGALGVELADLLADVVRDLARTGPARVDLTRTGLTRIDGGAGNSGMVRPLPPPARGTGGATLSVSVLAA